MSTKAQVKTQAKTPAAPITARIPQPPVAELEYEAERPDIAAQVLWEEGPLSKHITGRLGFSENLVRTSLE